MSRKKKGRASLRLALTLLLAVWAGLSARGPRALAAQVAEDDELVIHLWVDPRYGDDALASGIGSLNPNGANTIQMSSTDPTYGCSTNPCTYPGLRPNDILDSQGRALVHAPYPFRTITAAVAYINAIPGAIGASAGTPPLPYASPSPPAGTGRVWRHAIIHLLPGLYASEVSVAGSPNYHEDNGLVPNGEAFPIRLPPGVSVQGTNALNTWFDLRGQTAFEFGVHVDPATGQRVAPSDPAAVAIDGANSFISTVTFFGGGQAPDSQGWQSPGIVHGTVVIDEEVASRPTIVNCIFLKNRVGILINTDCGAITTDPNNVANCEAPHVRHDGTTIVNNTFVWNGVGLWNGQAAHVPHDPAVDLRVFGWSRLNVVNNIFDATVPGEDGSPVLDCKFSSGWPHNPMSWPGSSTFPFTDASFSGVGAEDMRTLAWRSGANSYEDFNAYERIVWQGSTGQEVRQRHNPPAAGGASYFAAAHLHIAQIRPGATDPVPDATREISQYTGFWSHTEPSGVKVLGVRGILFIRDLICAGRSNPGTPFPASVDAQSGLPSGFDGSPHDLRLSPTASRHDSNDAPPIPSHPNPLVDNGYGGSWPAHMENGQSVARPGALPLRAESAWRWTFDAMEFDTEGFGNPRVHDHGAYPNPAGRAASWQWIDVGADELGELIVAGYRFGTTMFVKLDAAHPANRTNGNVIRNHRQWYLGPAATAPTQAGFANTQPKFRSYADQGSGLLAVGLGWPATYEGPARGRTWHSVEQVFSTAAGVVWPRPWRFDTHQMMPTAPSCSAPSISMYHLYYATTSDVTPHLAPDTHPWWAEQYQPANANLMPPSKALWQECLGNDPSGQPIRNPFVYDSDVMGGAWPTCSVINPPGTHANMLLPPVLGGAYQWLDTISQYQSVSAFVTFNDWEQGGAGGAGAHILTKFDDWCRGYDHIHIPNRGWEHILESTVYAVGQEPTAIRFSLEWPDVGPFSVAKNIQSFLVLIDDAGD
jgi:hypothetical protein